MKLFSWQSRGREGGGGERAARRRKTSPRTRAGVNARRPPQRPRSGRGKDVLRMEVGFEGCTGERPGWDTCVGRHGKVSAKSCSMLRRLKREQAPALQRAPLGKLAGG